MKRREFLLKSTFTSLALASSSSLLGKISAAAAPDKSPAYHIEDIGEPATGDIYRTWRFGRHPHSGAPLAIGSLAKGGFVIVDLIAKTARQIRAPQPLDVGWAIGQAPDGRIYQANTGSGTERQLYEWNWQGEESRAVATLPGGWCFTLDVAADGCVYLPDYFQNRMYRYDPAMQKMEDLGDYKPFGQHIRNVYCGRDGWVYVSSTTYGGGQGRTVVVALDPRTNEKKVVSGTDASTLPETYRGLTKDAEGRVLVTAGRGGEARQYEIVQAKVQAEERPALPKIRDAELRWSGGDYLQEVRGSADVVVGNANGAEQTVTVARQDSPLRLFSIAAGGDKIWLGTIIPLTLWSYDPATKQSTPYGNPTPVGGEIYSMVFAQGKLFMASYPTAAITRLDPALPTEKRVRQLGKMKSEGLPLQRPHGRDADEKGTVFFAALGGYGCDDSGITRIEAETEEMTSWIYPDTTFGALVYCRKNGELLVSERRKGEGATRFTLLSPQDGRVLWSEPVFPDVNGAGGGVISWLDSGDDWVYGLHAHTAALFAFSLNEKKVVANQRGLRFGGHYYNALIDGRDGRIWGATDQGIYAATRDLKKTEMLAKTGEHGGQSFYCFGLAYDSDGALYFNSGTRLMKMREQIL